MVGVLFEILQKLSVTFGVLVALPIPLIVIYQDHLKISFDDLDFTPIDDVHPDDEADGAFLCHPVDDSPESLISSYRIVYDKWHNSVPESFRSLRSAAFNDAEIMSGFSFSTTTASSHGLWHRSQETLQAWQDHIKSFKSARRRSRKFIRYYKPPMMTVPRRQTLVMVLSIRWYLTSHMGITMRMGSLSQTPLAARTYWRF
ncbi:hypothetical protein VTN49DRAFT_895 [Thermomyces lanuginosus]|uniref:uncharacterized protein n=1 Tax=Thermomyces lanuginosus TaxID=5541 RepID=UPI003742A886